MTYENPRTVFQYRVSSVLSKEQKISPIFEDIFKLQQLLSFEKKGKVPAYSDSNESWRILYELYSEFGAEDFAKITKICKGKIVNFPSEEEYQDSIVTTLCYYYKEIEGIEDWEVIKERLNLPKLNAIKYGIRVRQLKNFIDSQTLSRISEKVLIENLAAELGKRK